MPTRIPIRTGGPGSGGRGDGRRSPPRAAGAAGVARRAGEPTVAAAVAATAHEDSAWERNFRDSYQRHLIGRGSLSRLEGGGTVVMERQINAWRQEARNNLLANNPITLQSPISLALMTCYSPPLTVWQKNCTTFFMSCKAIKQHPRRFLIGNAREQVTVPPGFLAHNNYVVPRIKRVADFLLQNVEEA